MDFFGTYLEVSPDSRLVWTNDEGDAGQTVTTVTFEETAGKTLLVLDTVTGSDAERLYARLGWQRCGVIPGYALLPRGGLCATTYFYKALNG